MSKEEFARLLEAAVARHIGKPGTIHDLNQLTGGANRTTWSFDADIEGRRERLILQLSNELSPEEKEKNPLAEISVYPTAEEGARLLIGGSTHAGEEAVLAELFVQLRKRYPDLYLIVVPRHFERGKEVGKELGAI